MKRFEHGGDIYTHRGALDFSANLNPLGMPQSAREALHAGIESGAFEPYPDTRCTGIARSIAKMEGVDVQQVVVCAGATDLIGRIVMAIAPEYALVCDPCYCGYEQALEQHGVKVMRHTLREEDDFALTDAFISELEHLAAARKPPELIFLANPNNPTGLVVDAFLLESVLKVAASLHSCVVVDECFIDFTSATSMIARINEYPQLIVMKAFTKIYAMAGLRLGYGICSESSLAARLQQAGQPWAVSTPAQLAGVAALGEQGFVEKTRSFVADVREKLKQALESEPLSLRVIDGQANYLMFECHRALYEPLLERGILIRRCENFEGLDGSWYRVAVRTHEENAQLIAALEEVLA